MRQNVSYTWGPSSWSLVSETVLTRLTEISLGMTQAFQTRVKIHLNFTKMGKQQELLGKSVTTLATYYQWMHLKLPARPLMWAHTASRLVFKTSLQKSVFKPQVLSDIQYSSSQSSALLAAVTCCSCWWLYNTHLQPRITCKLGAKLLNLGEVFTVTTTRPAKGFQEVRLFVFIFLLHFDIYLNHCTGNHLGS